MHGPATVAAEGQAAAPVGGDGAWPDNEPTRRTTRQHTRPHRCGGRRRPTGPGCGARGRRRGLAGLQDHADHPQHTGPHWCEGRRRPTGPGCSARGRRRGLAGLRDRPLRAEDSRVAISRAGRRPRAHQAARPTHPTAPGTPVGTQATHANGRGAVG